MTKALQNRIMGALMGAAVGDALGVPHEFTPREYFYHHPVTDMDEYGTHNQPMGTWSDDTSMTLATVDKLVEHIQLTSKLPSEGFLKRLIQAFMAWLQCGDYAPHGEVFDIGNTTHGTLMDYVITPDFESSLLKLEGATFEGSQGNGSLMRFIPFALWHTFERWPNALLAQCSKITHAHPVVIDVCTHYADTVRFSLSRDFEQAVSIANQNARKRNSLYVADLRELKNRPEHAVKSTGYVIDSIEAAYWCVYNGNGFEDTVLKAVNLGGDTDTIASIAGSLSGWLLGIDAMPEAWIEKLQKKERLQTTYTKYCKQILEKQKRLRKTENP